MSHPPQVCAEEEAVRVELLAGASTARRVLEALAPLLGLPPEVHRLTLRVELDGCPAIRCLLDDRAEK